MACPNCIRPPVNGIITEVRRAIVGYTGKLFWDVRWKDSEFWSMLTENEMCEHGIDPGTVQIGMQRSVTTSSMDANRRRKTVSMEDTTNDNADVRTFHYIHDRKNKKNVCYRMKWFSCQEFNINDRNPTKRIKFIDS